MNDKVISTTGYVNSKLIVNSEPTYYTDISSGPTYDYERIFEEMAKRFSRIPKMAYKCHSCGGELEIKPDQAVFKCPYCKTCYAIGTSRINER